MHMSKLMKALVFAGAAIVVSAVPVFAGTPTVTAVPEPSTIMMLAGGLGSVVGLRYYLLRKK
jgi:PEP-CTERM motif